MGLKGTERNRKERIKTNRTGNSAVCDGLPILPVFANSRFLPGGGTAKNVYKFSFSFTFY